MARLKVGSGELGDGRVHLLDVVQRLRRHPGLGRGLGHELVHRPLVHTGKAPGKMFDNAKAYLAVTRGSGVLRKGQHSWNISVTKEARVDPKVVLESSMECPSRGIFFSVKKNH